MRISIKNISDTTFTIPTDPASNETLTEMRIWEKNIDEYVNTMSWYRENMKTLYYLLWGQCTYIMRTRLEAIVDFDVNISATDKSLELLRSINYITFNFQSERYTTQYVHDMKRRFL